MCNSETPVGNTDKKIQNLIKGNALKYLRFKDQFDQIPEKEVVQFRHDVEDAYYRIHHAITIEFVAYDPYDNLEEMTREIDTYRLMKISTLNSESLLLPDLLNLKFCAVHDYLHYLLQQPFDFRGEFNVYKAQKYMHTTKMGRQILYSEVVLQAAYCTYFGKFADKQKVVL